MVNNVFFLSQSANIETLLKQCQKGNHLAQLEVYNRYQNAMYNISLNIVHNSAEAEDIMQESFITAFDKLDSLKNPKTFGGWLKRIVINRSLKAYDKSKKTIYVEDNRFVEEEAAPVLGDYSTVKVQQLKQAMRGLHNKYQQVLNLHFMEGFDYEEICEILDISYGNCRTLMSRAKDSLRKKLATS